MTGNEILKADMLDILFDNRNKDYGAYRLRKYYPNRLTFSLILALSSVLLLFFLVGPGNSRSITVRKNPDVLLKDVVLPQEKKKIEVIEPKRPAAAPPAAAPQKRITTMTIVHDKKINDQNTTRNADFDKFMVSDNDLDGIPGAPKVPATINTSGGGGDVKKAVSSTDAPLINRGPEFPGGMKAWLDFLNRHLRVPTDLEPGEKKTVLIRFEVAADGSVTGFQVVQSGGRYYDDEVIRVLKKMPKWKPALQSSQPVAVPFTQPVTFMGVDAE